MTRVSVNPVPVGRVLVLGGGYVGRRFAIALRRLGAQVTITSRHPPVGSGDGLRWVRFDPAQGHFLDPTELVGVTHVLVTIPPDEAGGDPSLGALGALLADEQLQWVGYLSTTGVYGDRGGAWVREDTPVDPTLERSRARYACECAWRASGFPLQVFRLPSIYGPGRTPFESLRAGQARLIHKPGQVFCRVHVDDIVGGLVHCLGIPANQRPGTLILADTCPCPTSETIGFAAHLLGCKLPDVQPYGRIASEMGAMARSFWSENRRVCSGLLRETLGYRLRYPSYREGYLACLEDGFAIGGSGNGTLRS